MRVTLLESHPSVHFREGPSNIGDDDTQSPKYGKLPVAGIPSVHSVPVLEYGQSLAGETSICPFQRVGTLNVSLPCEREG